MSIMDHFLGHDSWTTKQLLLICESLSDDQLDREFDIGHKTLRNTFDHMIHNMEVWSALMAQVSLERRTHRSVTGMLERLEVASSRLTDLAQKVASENAWNEEWIDVLDVPPTSKRYKTAFAHVITHNMHHRAQILYMLRLSGVESLPEGDVFSWEKATGGK